MLTRLSTILILFCCMGFQASAQSPTYSTALASPHARAFQSSGPNHTCGTEASPQDIDFLRQQRIQNEQTERQFLQNWNNRLSMPVMNIPIQAHIVRQTNGSGGLTTAQLNSAIASMNTYYLNANMQFFLCGNINYIDNSTYYNFDAADENTLCNPNDVANVINIYFFGSVSSGGSALCGYTRFPGPSSPDRIIMDNGCTMNGSTFPHEMGHFYTLYHTHGKTNTGTTDELVDGSNCTTNGDDVCDTPADPNLSGLVNGACQYTGTATDINGDTYVPNPNNIMSYSRQACRNLFTAGQYARINATAVNSPYRVFSCPASAADDAGIDSILTPQNNTFICDNPFVPEVELRNFGSNVLTSVTINYQIDNGTVNTFAWTGSLGAGNSVNVILPSINPPTGATFLFRAYTSNPNATTDGDVTNDTTTINTQYLSSQTLPYAEAFEGGAVPTDIQLLDQGTDGNTWEYTTAASGFGTGTGAMLMDNFSNNTSGTLDWIILPTLDLTNQSNTELTFDVAYARYDASYNDTLIIAVNDDCGTQYSLLYVKGGTDLATAADQTTLFAPSSTQWRTDTVDLSAFAGVSHLRIAFINQGGYSNGLYIDNVNVQGTTVVTADAGIDTILNPIDGAFFCDDPFAPTVVVENFGVNPLTSATINYQIDNGTVNTFAWTGSLAAGEKDTVNLPVQAAPLGGAFAFRAYTTLPNGATDSDNLNDTAVVVAQYRTTLALPYNEALDAGVIPTDMEVLDQTNDGFTWGYSSTSSSFGTGTGSLVMDNYTNNTSATFDWVTLPTLDLSSQTSTQLTFDVAYTPYDNTYSDTLIVAINDDCGTQYTLLYVKGGTNLSTAPSQTSLFTPTATQWRTDTVDLSAYAGVSHLRVAFINKGGYGNRMFIDNINVQTPVLCNMTATTTVNNISCNGGNDGAATVVPVNGTANYNYTWSNGQTGVTATGLIAATYTVTVTDASGCFATATAVPTEPTTALSSSIISQSNVNCNGGNSGTATATGIGGTPNYNYTWSNGQTTATATGLVAASYTVNITDDNACTSTATVSISEPNTLTVNAVDNGNGTATATPSGGTANYSYLWSSNAANQTTATATNLNNGSYTVTVTDQNGCTATATVNITVVGLTAIANLQRFDVMPNPNKGTFIVQVDFEEPREAVLMIRDVLGRTLRELPLIADRQRVSIDLTDYASSIYFVVLRTDNQVMTKKISVQK